ncbi:MAG: hypothetical protein J0M24_19115 [Verrucomicrobia bacterium]|nr:hypothetical protein [Verrucomicrobiota bacterium]
MKTRFSWSAVFLVLVGLIGFGAGSHPLRAAEPSVRTRVRVPANVENQAPSVTWSGVTNQVLLRFGSVQLFSVTSDADGKVARVEYWANGTNFATVFPPPLFPPPVPGSRPDLFPFSFAPVVPGTYRLTAVAVDNLGATNASSEVVIRLNAYPEMVVGEPQAGNWTAPVNFLLPVTVVDPDGTIVEVVLETSPAGLNRYRTLAVKTAPPYDFQVNDFFGPPSDLRVSARDSDDGLTRQTIRLTQLRPAPGDDPLNPIRLTGDVEGLVVDLRRASSDLAEFQLGRLPSVSIASCYSFLWTAPADRLVSVDTFGSTFDTSLQVNRVDAGKPQTPVVRSEDDPLRTPWSRLKFEARLGQTFQIYAFALTNRDVGNLMFNFRTTPWTPGPSAPAPANDAFANAQVLEANAPAVAGTTRGATGDQPAREVTFGGTNSVWYQWTAPADGLAEVSTSEVTGDTVLSVFTNNPRVVRGQNDDRSETDTSSRVPFRVQAGVLYYIQVGANAPTEGDFKIQLRFPVEDLFTRPPANDAFAQATVIEGLFVSVPGTLVGATGELTSERAEVWWRWTSPVTGPVHAALVPWTTTFTPPRLRVLHGDSTESLVAAPNALPDWLTSESISPRRFLATAGTTYYLVVDSNQSSDFWITLNAQMSPPLQTALPDPGAGPQKLRIQATRPQRVVLERSLDLKTWAPVATEDLPIGTTDLPLPEPGAIGGNPEFFRVSPQ